MLRRRPSDQEDAETEDLQLAVQSERALDLVATATERSKALIQPQSASEYLLLKRSFQGVETPATGAAFKVAGGVEAGRSGRAAAYVTEGA